MQYGTLGAATMSAAVVLSGGFAGAQEAEQAPLSRTLSVEQTTVYDVLPPAQVQGDLDVVAWVDRPDYTYAGGENVKLFVETSKDAYVTVLNVDPAGETTILFPNEYQSDNLVRANRVLEVPDPASQSRIVVTGVTGTELLKVVASTRFIQPFEALQLIASGPFQVLRTRAQGAARSLKVAMTPDPNRSRRDRGRRASRQRGRPSGRCAISGFRPFPAFRPCCSAREACRSRERPRAAARPVATRPDRTEEMRILAGKRRATLVVRRGKPRV